MRGFVSTLVLWSLLSCSGGDTSPVAPPRRLEAAALFGATPLTDFLPAQTYAGLAGGLYGGGSNTPPKTHADAGLLSASRVRPLRGSVVVLALGMSNAQLEFAAFERLAGASAAANGVTLVNGAQKAAPATAWDSPMDRAYDDVRDARLAPRGLAEADVQVVWLKLAHVLSSRSRPPTLPYASADAFVLGDRCLDAIDAIQARYPNVRQVFLSSRTYGGYGVETSPEPYAYETGFGIRSCILERGGRTDPFVGWGPYLWAAGPFPRSDGLVWLREDFKDDGIHPRESGQNKVARMLEDFFEGSPYTAWYR